MITILVSECKTCFQFQVYPQNSWKEMPDTLVKID